MTVLILCEDLDLTVDRVIVELAERKVPVVRADTAWFPARLRLDSWLDGAGWSGTLHTSGRTVQLADVRSIWYRRPTAFRFPEGMSEPERRHAGWEARFGLGGVLGSLPVLWVNHPQREADACYKPAQLVAARRAGMRVPDTIVTNDPDGVRRFAARHRGQIVVKTLSSPAVLEAAGITVAHTRRLTPADLADLSGVDSTTHLFQAWVEKSHEVRVTVVGRRMFAVAIEAATPAAREDWRNDFAALTYHPVGVPPPVQGAIIAYLTGFGLCYAAFDFVVDHSERWWFLEANPGGQYGWLQAATGLPISAAVADVLAKGLS